MGTPAFAVQEPSFGLYNRYDSRIRIFYYIEPDNGEAPDNVLVTLSHFAAPGSLENVNALFENLNIPANALVDFDKYRGAPGVTQLNAGEAGSTWYMLEMAASYDPCACQYTSALKVQPTLSDADELLFEIEGTGFTQPLYAPGSLVNSYVGNALDYGNGLIGSVAAGYKLYKDLNGYIDGANQSGTLVEGLVSELPSWFSSAGFTAKLLGFLVGKGPKLAGYNHNYMFTGNGTLTDNDAYAPEVFYTPGSFYDPYQLEAYRPVYDNPLGIFTVLEAPTIEKIEFEVKETNGNNTKTTLFESYRYTGGLKYHINTVAGLEGSPVKLMGALIFSDCQPNSPVTTSPAINLTCLEDFVFILESSTTEVDLGNGSWWTVEQEHGCEGREPELQIIAVLESSSPGMNDEILFSARYRTQTVSLPGTGIPQNPFDGLSVDEIFNICDPAVDQPVEDEELIGFCRGKYDPSLGRSDLEVVVNREQKEGKPLILDSGIFPNPFQAYFNLKVSADWIAQPLNLTLYDVLGRPVWKAQQQFATPGNYGFYDGLANLGAGAYTLQVSGDTFSSTLSLQKQ